MHRTLESTSNLHLQNSKNNSKNQVTNEIILQKLIKTGTLLSPTAECFVTREARSWQELRSLQVVNSVEVGHRALCMYLTAAYT